MSEINNIYYKANSDTAIAKSIADFIKHHRLQQNKTQAELATAAGINRTTLLEFEKGHNISLITLIQLLRALDLLYALKDFEVSNEPSPMQLAEMQQHYRKRASGAKPSSNKPKSDW